MWTTWLSSQKDNCRPPPKSFLVEDTIGMPGDPWELLSLLAKPGSLIFPLIPQEASEPNPTPAEDWLNKDTMWTMLFSSSWDVVFVSNAREEPYMNSDSRAQHVHLSLWFFSHSSFPCFCSNPNCLRELTGHRLAHGVLQSKWKRKDSCSASQHELATLMETNTKKYTAAEAQMSLERHPAALFNPAGMCPG